MKIRLPVALTSALLFIGIQAQAAPLNTDQIRQGYLEHGAKAQFHRWFQLYENPLVPLANQLDILAKDIAIKSGLGEAKGHDAYSKRVTQIPKQWKNSHYVKEAKVSKTADGKMSLTAKVQYLNQGMLPDGAVRTADLSYTTSLSKADKAAPKFASIQIAQIADGKAEKFTNSFPENRVKSLMHRWLYLIEDPARQLEPFKELLAPEFSLNFSSGPITDFAGFEKWFRGPASSVVASTHVPSNFSYKATGENQYSLQAIFDWQGLLPGGKELIGQTKHTWLILDNPKERFARIKEISVQVTKPFGPLVKEGTTPKNPEPPKTPVAPKEPAAPKEPEAPKQPEAPKPAGQ